MCLYVGSEVILANLLSQKNGVSQKDIALYCERLKSVLSNKNHIYNVYINYNNKEMGNTLTKYNQEFRYFQGCYFVNERINLKHFNARYDDSVVSTFAEVAQMV